MLLNCGFNFKSESFRRLGVAYNNSDFMLHKILRFCRDRSFQIQANIKMFSALIHKLMYRFVNAVANLKIYLLLR